MKHSKDIEHLLYTRHDSTWYLTSSIASTSVQTEGVFSFPQGTLYVGFPMYYTCFVLQPYGL